jgi:hypothetical protein
MTQKLRISLSAIGMSLGIATAVLCATGSSVMAKPAATKATGPAPLAKDFMLAPNGLRWGIGFPMLAKVYDDAFDAEYAPVYKQTEPGRQMELLDSEVAEKKSLVRRSKVEFGSSPTGVDSGPLNGEYGYNNGESMAKLPLKGGTVRYFFFHTDRLWKVYDEYKIGKGSKLGATWEDAVKALSELFGGPAQMLEPDSGASRSFQEAVWTTATMQIRAINRSHQNVVAVAWVDRGVSDKIISARRTSKLANPTAMDSKVRDVTAPDPNVQKLRTGPEAPADTKKSKK